MLSNRQQFSVDDLRIHFIGNFAAEAKLNRAIGTVSFAGQRERPIKIDLYPGGLTEVAVGFKLYHEAPRCPHWPHGMRTRRSNADFEQLKNTGHASGSYHD